MVHYFVENYQKICLVLLIIHLCSVLLYFCLSLFYRQIMKINSNLYPVVGNHFYKDDKENKIYRGKVSLMEHNIFYDTFFIFAAPFFSYYLIYDLYKRIKYDIQVLRLIYNHELYNFLPEITWDIKFEALDYSSQSKFLFTDFDRFKISLNPLENKQVSFSIEGSFSSWSKDIFEFKIKNLNTKEYVDLNSNSLVSYISSIYLQSIKKDFISENLIIKNSCSNYKIIDSFTNKNNFVFKYFILKNQNPISISEPSILKEFHNDFIKRKQILNSL